MTPRMKLVPRSQTAEERYAWLQMEAREVLRTECKCGHALSTHSRVRKVACEPLRGAACRCTGFEAK